jgi:hypothetical protein
VTTFPDTPVSSTSVSVAVVVTNSGTAASPPLSLLVTGPNATEFVLQPASDTCTGQPLSPGTCSVSYRFTPGMRGLRQATLTISAGALAPVATNLRGTGQAPAALSFASTTLNFGSAVTGSTNTTASIQLNNTGDLPSGMPIFTPAPMAEFSQVSNTCGAAVQPGPGCSIILRFSPAIAGNRSGTLTATATPGGTSQIVALVGTGVAPGSISFSPPSRDFGPVVIGTIAPPVQDFTISNGGGTNLTGFSVMVGGTNPSSFPTSLNTCGTTLAAMGSCTIRVTFNPQARGALSAFLVASSSTSTMQAGLSGVGNRPATLVARQPTLAFPDILVGQSALLPFTVDNTGDVASGPVTFSSTNLAYAVQPGTCSGPVAPGGFCSGDVRFSTTTPAFHLATITINASPGGGSTFTANGAALTPAALTLTPEAGSSENYGDVPTSTTRTQRFTVRNTGTQASGPLALSTSGPNGTLWVVETGAGNCALGQPLPGSGSCTSTVRFFASTNGMKNAVLTASATPGTTATLSLSANVQNPALLTVTQTMQTFPGQEVNVGTSPPDTWRVTNSGDVTSGTLSFTNTNQVEFVVSNNTCSGTLGPGASCNVTLAFRPVAGGLRTGTLSVSAAGANTVQLTASGQGQWRLFIVASFAGGTVSTTDNRLMNCDSAGCSTLYDQGSVVTVRATPVAGSGQHFTTFVAPSSCGAYGHGRDCTVTLNGALTVNARFGPQFDNTVFVSSVPYPANLGSPANYDAQCNMLANAAGLNIPNGYVAWISSSSSSAAARLGTGWGAYRNVRGTYVAVSLATLNNDRLMVPIDLDEWGKLTHDSVWTTTTATGATSGSLHCSNWTTNSGSFTASNGISSGGPSRWTNAATVPCSGQARIYCFGRGTSTPGTPNVPGGARIAYVTAPSVSMSGSAGLSTLDAFCNANRPTGYTTRNFVAFVSTTTATAASRLNPTAEYWRPDGTRVGLGTFLASNGFAGFWYANDGTYVGQSNFAWTGAAAPDQLGTPASTCSNWVLAVTGTVGLVSSVAADHFNAQTLSCGNSARVYCIEP